MRTKRLAFIAAGCLAWIALLGSPSLGWEFGMTGSMNWYTEYYTQAGDKGFFGPYNVDNGFLTTTANLNYWWNGARLAQNLVTGADASRSYFYVLIEPTVTINPAVKLRGRYRLGQWKDRKSVV